VVHFLFQFLITMTKETDFKVTDSASQTLDNKLTTENGSPKTAAEDSLTAAEERLTEAEDRLTEAEERLTAELLEAARASASRSAYRELARSILKDLDGKKRWERRVRDSPLRCLIPVSSFPLCTLYMDFFHGFFTAKAVVA
jgi:hypothetical protein